MITTLTKCPELPDEIWLLILSFINGFIPDCLKLSCKMLYNESKLIDKKNMCSLILNDIILNSWVDIDINNGTLHTGITLNGKDVIYVPFYNIREFNDGIAKLYFY